MQIATDGKLGGEKQIFDKFRTILMGDTQTGNMAGVFGRELLTLVRLISHSIGSNDNEFIVSPADIEKSISPVYFVFGRVHVPCVASQIGARPAHIHSTLSLRSFTLLAFAHKHAAGSFDDGRMTHFGRHLLAGKKTLRCIYKATNVQRNKNV